MSFCHHCGTELPAAANFCSHCGTERRAREEKRDQPPPEWETCEILPDLLGEKWGIFPRDVFQFRAQAKGPGGEYEAGESPQIKAGLGDYYAPNYENKGHRKALAALADSLEKDGWEKIGKGEAWFNLKFRRGLPAK